MTLSGPISDSWIPAGISSFKMHRREKFHDWRMNWEHARLDHDGRKKKVCKIEFLDEEEGLMMSAEGFS